MPLYLDSQTRPILKKAVEMWLDAYPYDWRAQRLLGKVVEEAGIQNEIGKCAHEPGTYYGKKVCCVKCGSFFEEGMGFHWELKPNPKVTKINKLVRKPDTAAAVS